MIRYHEYTTEHPDGILTGKTTKKIKLDSVDQEF